MKKNLFVCMVLFFFSTIISMQNSSQVILVNHSSPLVKLCAKESTILLSKESIRRLASILHNRKSNRKPNLIISSLYLRLNKLEEWYQKLNNSLAHLDMVKYDPFGVDDAARNVDYFIHCLKKDVCSLNTVLLEEKQKLFFDDRSVCKRLLLINQFNMIAKRAREISDYVDGAYPMWMNCRNSWGKNFSNSDSDSDSCSDSYSDLEIFF